MISPSIRVWGTIGFVAAMWFVNSAYLYDGHFGFTLSESNPAAPYRFQYTSMQLFCSALFGVLTGLYALTLPAVNVPQKSGDNSLADIFGLRAFRLFKIRQVRVFLIFAVFTGVCLQISNGYAIPYINHFMASEEYFSAFASGNATMLFSLSQISEAVCVLFVGVAMKKLGFRWVIFLALAAWCLRFLLLGFGNPGGGLWMLVGSMLIYGIAFNFFNISGHIYMDQQSSPATRGFGQGLLMMMSNGIGATFGMMGAGAIVNGYCRWEMMPLPGGRGMMRLFMGEWTTPWLIFGLYALAIGLLFLIFFRKGRRQPGS